MMAGNPNWWNLHPQSSQHHLQQLSSINNSPQSCFVYGVSDYPTVISSASSSDNHSLDRDFPAVRSFSQLLLGDERYGGHDGNLQQQKHCWEEQVSMYNPCSNSLITASQAVQGHLYDASNHGNGFLNFVEGNKNQNQNQHRHNQDQSSECNSSSSNLGGVCKKARVQVQQRSSSSKPALKNISMQVRKEKLGDRITALHQLVSPFGKTDTASVLSEAIACIRFLRSQIEALSSPYMRNESSSATANTSHRQRSGVRSHGDLRSRGLRLVPVSCIQNVGIDATAIDYWTPNYH